MSSTITVIAAKGRRVPIHPQVKAAEGGALLFVTDEEPVVLPDVSYVRRRVNAGDLVEVKPKPVQPMKSAAPVATTKKES